MTPYYRDDWLTIYQGDVRAVLPELAVDSVDCIVTSPPYWGLRDYGTANWMGGSEDCDHSRPAIPHTELAAAAEASDGNRRNESGTRAAKQLQPFTHICGKCGAVRQDAQLGLERTPEEYVANLVAIFRELRRVLKPSGTCWLNLGDSYSNSAVGSFNGGKGQHEGAGFDKRVPGLKPKDLVGIPWRVAFALQADGWYLRSDVIWAKPNPMPESVTDRPTKAHEYLFLLTKSARYYFDADAVREAYLPDSIARDGRARLTPYAPPGQSERGEGPRSVNGGRNLRSVWTIATRPYPGAHFAVFPPELPERCIKAGSSERGVCPECGAPWERVVEREGGERYATGKSAAKNGAGLATAFSGYTDGSSAPTFTTVGWRPPCHCSTGSGSPADEGVVPAVVLDPFAGSGTTGMVANRLSRRAILIDLNGDYLKQQLTRNAQTPLGLAT